MKTSPTVSDNYYPRIKWLIYYRLIFASFLLGSTILFQVIQKISHLDRSIITLYSIIFSIAALSVVYLILAKRAGDRPAFVYSQFCVDTVIITVIIFVTGGSGSSVFIFLYLILIICASIILFRKGSMVVATLCSAEYAVMTLLEYAGIGNMLIPDRIISTDAANAVHVIGQILVISAACFAVAYLSSLLAEQAEKSKRELDLMERRAKRFEKLAAVGEMAAGLAHEIKNPLASISGAVQLLNDDNRFDPDHNRLMKIILREADRLSSLVNDFLLFARPRAGEMKVIDLENALTDTVELFEKDLASNGGITIRKHLSPDVTVRMDPVHLRQILWNLLLNASDAVEGMGTVEIDMYPVKDNYVVIKIADDGCGIPPELLDSIFDPFFTTKPNGTGLGLSIVYGMLESYGGWLDVESRVGHGTTFTLTMRAS